MDIITYLHQLFNEHLCNKYIHFLRWQGKKLQCPRCLKYNIAPWGNHHRRPGIKRHMCKDCHHTFNDLTNTPLHGCKLSLKLLVFAVFLMCLSCSSRRICRELGIHIRTAYHWCWKFRNAAISYEIYRQLDGVVEADEIYQTAGNKGQSKTGGSKKLNHTPRSRGKKQPHGRGHYEKDSPAIIAWVSRSGHRLFHVVKDFTSRTVQKSAEIAVKAGSRIYTDSAKSYQALVGYTHEYVNHSQKEYARGEVHENGSENEFSLLRPFLVVFRGINKHNLSGYIGFYQFLRNYRKLNAFQQTSLILQALLEPELSQRIKDGDFVKMFDHFNLLHTVIN
jgi:transposase-like protein